MRSPAREFIARLGGVTIVPSFASRGQPMRKLPTVAAAGAGNGAL